MRSRTSIHLHLPKALAGHKEKWSVKVGDNPVQYHEQALLVNEPSRDPIRFTVAPAGYQRYLDTGIRNVHAFVRGYLAPKRMEEDVDLKDYTEVIYDISEGIFHTNPTDPEAHVAFVETADAVFFTDRVYALNPQ